MLWRSHLQFYLHLAGITAVHPFWAFALTQARVPCRSYGEKRLAQGREKTLAMVQEDKELLKCAHTSLKPKLIVCCDFASGRLHL